MNSWIDRVAAAMTRLKAIYSPNGRVVSKDDWDRELQLWLPSLEGQHVDDIEAACNDARDAFKWFPKPYELHDLIRKNKRAREARTPKLREPEPAADERARIAMGLSWIVQALEKPDKKFREAALSDERIAEQVARTRAAQTPALDTASAPDHTARSPVAAAPNTDVSAIVGRLGSKMRVY